MSETPSTPADPLGPASGYGSEPTTPNPSKQSWTPTGQPGPQGQYPPGYYYQSPYPQSASAPTNGFAIASMVLGITWIYWIGSILALVFGYVALDQIRKGNQQGAGMAMAGIVLGWIGVGVLLIVLFLVLVLQP
ncbi:MAG: DUF4190 domain-containing protein [Actinomycetota bacterium]